MANRRIGGLASRSTGFTLIEAMVAMVIIGGAGMALFSWVNNSITSLRRVEDANTRNAAMLNVVEYMQSVNPMLTPEGKAELGDYRLSWHATVQNAVVDGSGYPRGLSMFQLALYDTEVKVERGEAQPWFDFKLKLVGYKKVRDSMRPF